MYLNLFMCLHVVSVLTIVAMPRFLSAEKPPVAISAAAEAISIADPPKENVSRDVRAAATTRETLPLNCDTSLNEKMPPFISRSPLYTSGPKTMPTLMRSRSTEAAMTSPERSLFDSDADRIRFNEKMEHNGGGALHQRITAGSFMHHGHVDAKF